MSEKSNQIESGTGIIEPEQLVKKLEQELRKQKQINEALEEKERMSRIMIDHTFQFLATLTSDGILIDINQTSIDSVGAKKSEVLGKPFWETPWWTYSSELQQKIKTAIETASKGEFVRFEATLATANGSLNYGDFSLNPVKDDTGQVVYLIAESRNITERKRLEDALKQSENTSRALLDAPVESALLMDANFLILAINKAAARMFDRPEHEIIGKNIFDLLPPDVTTYRKKKVFQCVKTKKPVRFEDNHKGRYYNHNIFPILNREGALIQIAIYSNDVTDYELAMIRIRKRTNELIESEKKYRTLVENVPLVVYQLKPGGELSFVNDFVEEIFGYTAADFFRYPKLWTERIYSKDRERVSKLLENCFKGGRECVNEYRIRHKKGYLVSVMDHAIPSRSSDNVITSVDGIIIDISQRVELQEQLVQAEGLKTISEVSARLAHELRNPLMSAGGFARQLLNSLSPSDPNRDKVKIIVQEVSRLESILRMILNYMHPVKLDLSPVDPESWVKNAISAVSAAAAKKDIQITSQLRPELPEIYIDLTHMSESLETLLQNAIYQMEKGTSMSISTDREGEIFKLQICYPVKHIDQDDVKAFFYPFAISCMKLDTVDLSTVKTMINKHGGTIKANLESSGKIIIEISLLFGRNLSITADQGH